MTDHKSKKKKKADDVGGHWSRINMDGLVSGCQTGQSTCESKSASSVVSARRDLVFAFVVSSF